MMIQWEKALDHVIYTSLYGSQLNDERGAKLLLSAQFAVNVMGQITGTEKNDIYNFDQHLYFSPIVIAAVSRNALPVYPKWA